MPARALTPPAAGDVLTPTETSGLLTDGPWDSAFWVHVAGDVRSKSNYRHDRNSRAKWATVEAYEAQVRADVRRARPTGWGQGNPEVPVPGRPRVVVALAARTMLDIGNVSKSVLDACQGVLYVSDAQVGAAGEFGTRTACDPGLFAAFALLPVGATAGDCARALADLVDRLGALSTS